MRFILYIVISIGYFFPEFLIAQNIENQIESLNKINNFFNNQKFTYTSFIDEMKDININKKSILGFNYKKLSASHYGNPYSIGITMCTQGDNIFYLLLSFDIEATSLLKNESLTNNTLRDLLHNWRLIKEEEGEYYILKYENDELIKSFRSSVNLYLGDLNPVLIEDVLIEKSYKILIDFYSTYDYGFICYGNKVEPLGRKSIELLIKENRIDLIKNILRGYNPEGRIYAMEALLKINSYNENNLDKEDLEVIKKLIKLPLVIRTCYGSFIDYELQDALYIRLKKNKSCSPSSPKSSK